jgi:riboflavin kinase
MISFPSTGRTMVVLLSLLVQSSRLSRSRAFQIGETAHIFGMRTRNRRTVSAVFSSSSSSSSSNIPTEQEHLQYQQDTFDRKSDWFADRDKEVTPDLEAVYEAMAEDMLRQFLPQDGGDEEEEDDSSNLTPTRTRTLHILDVACGTGVLWEFLIDVANQANVQLKITGVDLSPLMAGHASNRAESLLEDEQKKNELEHTIQVITSDIIAFCASANDPKNNGIVYDGIILNACFGNFFNPGAVLQALPVSSTSTTSTYKATTIAISHPLGAAFVQQLHEQDPQMVPHLLPTTTLSMVQQWTLRIPLIPTYLKETPYYLMMLQKKPRRAKPLPKIQRYRGVVDQGYGRGGKKLGVPTANLPASLFQNALQNVETGVYFGWASLEHMEGVFKAVVNVGYSPTFEGEENKEKIIEAHLILDKDEELDDFYGQVMRLQLSGFLREEQKFDSFPALVAQIHADIDDAKNALEEYSPFSDLQADDFISPTKDWIGSGGGDESASWEFVDHLDTLTAMVDES